jgi:Icc-related predicted phosphoesterase
MKVVFVSDTHTLHEKISVPSGDILVHAGDLCIAGTIKEAQAALDWLNSTPHTHVVIVAGNHDWAFAIQARKTQLNFGRVVYLEDNEATVGGLRIYGSPQTPEFCSWAFNVDRGPAIKHYWDMIPENLDLLITHGPPMGILDQIQPHLGSKHLGCEELMLAVERTKPKIHVFGHIHGGYGKIKYENTLFINAAICNEAYNPVNPPIVVEI